MTAGYPKAGSATTRAARRARFLLTVLLGDATDSLDGVTNGSILGSISGSAAFAPPARTGIEIMEAVSAHRGRKDMH